MILKTILKTYISCVFPLKPTNSNKLKESAVHANQGKTYCENIRVRQNPLV